jgi:hypothetical protein
MKGLAVRFGILLYLILCLVLPSPAFAQTDVLADPCSNVDIAKDSPTCQSRTEKNPITGTDGLLYKVSLVIAIISGIAAIIVIIVGGMQYVTSGGDSQKITSAKHTIVGAVIGLIVIVLAQTIITFIIKRL